MTVLGSLLLAFVLPALSCRYADRGTTARVDTLLDGRIEVADTGAPAWTRETAWRLEEDLRLGTAEGEGPEAEQFGTISSVVADSRGRIYVLDAGAQQIRVFSPTGRFSHTIGGRGEGPGEFVDAYAMALGSGDTLWVTDGRGRRYSAFTPDGRFVESRRRPLARWHWLPGSFLDDGSFVDLGLEVVRGGAPVNRVHPIRLPPEFRRADSLPPLEYTREMMPDGRGPQLFFSGDLTLALDGEGAVWFAHTRVYRIYRRTLEGDTTLVFTLPEEAPPVTGADREIVRRVVGDRPARLERYLDALPDTRPVVHRILTDGAGHVFVFADVAGQPAGTVVDVFRESGRYLVRLTLPTPVPLFPPPLPVVAHATPTHLFVVVEDALDVPYVSRLRIVRN